MHEEIKALMQEQQRMLGELYDSFKNHTYSYLLYEKKIAYHSTMSSLNYLSNVNTCIDSYMKNWENPTYQGGEILLVFGLLQALFVGIDALYELSRGVTRRKWSVNVNSNRFLHQIKYIRNDVVGHPSYRVYSKQDIGFCRLNTESLSLKEITYTAYTIIKNQEIEEERTVAMDKLLYNYYLESNSTLEAIYSRLDYEKEAVVEDLSVSLTDDIYELFHDAKSGVENRQLLEKIKESYIRMAHSSKENDRFVWRIKLIGLLFDWNESNEKRNEMIRFMTLGQISKLHSMGLQFDKDTGVKFAKSKLPIIKYPTLLKYFYKYTEKNYNKVKHYLEVIHDSYHPLYDTALKHLAETGYDNDAIVEICLWLEEIKKSESDKIFLIGSELKRAKKYMEEMAQLKRK